MCGRFTLKTPFEDLAKHFRVDVPDLPLRFNIAPTQPVATVLVLTGDRQFRMMRWGLVPYWAKDPSIGSRMINARAETIAEKPAFKKALHERRCIIMSDGFYEWAKKGQAKQPMYIVNRDGTPFGFAGLWDRWQPPEGGEPVESCTIITTDANELVGAFHDRMPVILGPEDYDSWLDPAIREPERLLPLLKSYPAAKMEAYPVSPVVNSPANESPECVKPLVGVEG
jgi:putative SOS response-associated peptidase YedK